MTASNSISPARRVASCALFCAMAMLAACSQTGAGPSTADAARGAASMSTLSAMGPVYFGDTIALDQNAAAPQEVWVAGNQR